MSKEVQEKPVKYAGINNRMFAATIDLAIVYFVVDFLTRIIFHLYYPHGSEYYALTKKIVGEFPQLSNHADRVFILALSKYPAEMHLVLEQMAFSAILQILLIGLYFVPLTKIYGGTIGKKILGFKVIDSITGKNISYMQSAVRYLGYLPSALILGMGLIAGAANRKKRCWHDVMADSVVIIDENSWYKIQYNRIKTRVKKYFNLS